MAQDKQTNAETKREYTEEDEAKMDRVAQAGVDGAFGADHHGEKERKELIEDAEDAFEGDKKKDQ